MYAYHDDLLLYSIFGLVKRFIENLTLAITGCKSVNLKLKWASESFGKLIKSWIAGLHLMISDLEGPG